MKWSGVKLDVLEQVILHEYSNGLIECTHQRMDKATRRQIPHTLFRTLRDDIDPFTPADFLFIASAQLVAEQLDLKYELPF